MTANSSVERTHKKLRFPPVLLYQTLDILQHNTQDKIEAYRRLFRGHTE